MSEQEMSLIRALVRELNIAYDDLEAATEELERERWVRDTLFPHAIERWVEECGL